MPSLKHKSASTRFQSQSPNPSRAKISDQDFQIKGQNLDSNNTKANSEYSNSSHFEKIDHRVRNINAWVSSYRDKSKGHIKNKLSAKKLFAKDEQPEPFKSKLSTSFSALNSDGTDKEDCSADHNFILNGKTFGCEAPGPTNGANYDTSQDGSGKNIVSDSNSGIGYSQSYKTANSFPSYGPPSGLTGPCPWLPGNY